MSFKEFERTSGIEFRELEAIEIDWYHNRGALLFFLDSDKNNDNPFRINIYQDDLLKGSPKLGDMVARNVNNHLDQWLVTREYFEENYSRKVTKDHVENVQLVHTTESKNESWGSKDIMEDIMNKATQNYMHPSVFTGTIEIMNGHVIGVHEAKNESVDIAVKDNLELCSDGVNSFDNAITEESGPFPNISFDFGHAIAAAKAGKKVARKGWNGKGMFAYIVPGGRFPVMAEAAKDHFGKGAYVRYRPYWALKTADEDVATWAPSGSDSLAEDWIILD